MLAYSSQPTSVHVLHGLSDPRPLTLEPKTIFSQDHPSPGLRGFVVGSMATSRLCRNGKKNSVRAADCSRGLYMRTLHQLRPLCGTASPAPGKPAYARLRDALMVVASLLALAGCDSVSSVVDGMTPAWISEDVPYAGDVRPTTAPQQVAAQTRPSLPPQPVAMPVRPALTPSPAVVPSAVVPDAPSPGPASSLVPSYVPDSLRYLSNDRPAQVPPAAQPAPVVQSMAQPVRQGADVRAALGMTGSDAPQPAQMPAAVARAAQPPAQPPQTVQMANLGSRVVQPAGAVVMGTPVMAQPATAPPAAVEPKPPVMASLAEMPHRVVSASNTVSAAAASYPAGPVPDVLAGRVIRPQAPAGSQGAPNLSEVPARPVDIPSAALQQQRLQAMQAAQVQVQQMAPAVGDMSETMQARFIRPDGVPAQPSAMPQQMPAMQGRAATTAPVPLRPVMESSPAPTSYVQQQMPAPVQMAPVQTAPVQVAQVSGSVPSGVNSAFQRALQQSAPNRYRAVPPMQQPLTPSAVPQAATFARPMPTMQPTPSVVAPPPMMPTAAPAQARPTLMGNIYFSADSVRLGNGDIAQLGDLAARLRQQGTPVRVVGYAARPSRGDATERMVRSFSLSVDRADAVARKLMEFGVPATLLQVEGKGTDMGAAAAVDSAYANRVDVLQGS
jgi:outer membrane protein OmpA-like peptidoglycan-associated protein